MSQSQKEVVSMAMKDMIPSFRSRNSVARNQSAISIASLHEDMNRLFEDFWREFELPGSASGRSIGFPRIEMSETDKELKIEAELPGMDEKDIEVLLKDGVLTIRGEKRSETEDKSRRLSERFYGAFERHIALPVDVQEDHVNASFKKGVLAVTLQKAEGSAQSVKRIPISSR
jgi:HSP20 family protein